jgi:hypothetical protein
MSPAIVCVATAGEQARRKAVAAAVRSIIG